MPPRSTASFRRGASGLLPAAIFEPRPVAADVIVTSDLPFSGHGPVHRVTVARRSVIGTSTKIMVKRSDRERLVTAWLGAHVPQGTDRFRARGLADGPSGAVV